MFSEEDKVLEDLEHGAVRLRNHLSQKSYELAAISEVEKVTTSKLCYPLDGRNLEFTKLKRKRLAASAARPSSPRKIRARKESEGARNEIFFSVENCQTQFRCPETLWGKLYDFQRLGVQFLCSKFAANTGGLLADEMGLGKSVQVVAFLQSLVSTYGALSEPVLLICPTTLVSHWEDQFETWCADLGGCFSIITGEDIFSKNRQKIEENSNKSCIMIVSYEMFRIRLDKCSSSSSKKYSVVILDEAQRIRNPDSKITQAVKQVDCCCRIALSGSPIQNNLSELWSIFDFVAPGRLGTLPTFQEELAIPIEDGTRPKASYAQIQLSHRCAVVVRDLTAPLMLRRVKSEYADQLELADKQEQVLFCQLSAEQLEVYCRFLSTETVKSVIQKTERGKTFYCLSVLRRIANHPDLLLSEKFDVDDFGDVSRSGKLQVLVPLLQLWRKQGKRCLIFSQSLGMLDILQLVLGNLDLSFARMDGSTPTHARNALMEEFDASRKKSQESSLFCLLLSTRVGGVGLNLTAAERVVIFDPDWNPMTDAQARERSWRIGQIISVKIYRLIAADTVEEVICKRQIYKHHLSQKILLDPRQGRVGDWDGLHDLFKAPLGATAAANLERSKTTSAILKILEQPMNGVEKDDRHDEDVEDYKSLITKVWNQDEIELPNLCGSLVDAAEADMAASKAVRAVLAEADIVRDITVPTWTGKSGSSNRAVTTSSQRSQSLVSKLRAGTPEIPSSHKPVVRHTFESEKLLIEKSVVRDLLGFFQKRDRYSAETDLVLRHFAKKISSGQSEIFRSCLRELCDFDGNLWTLKRSHR